MEVVCWRGYTWALILSVNQWKSSEYRILATASLKSERFKGVQMIKMDRECVNLHHTSISVHLGGRSTFVEMIVDMIVKVTVRSHNHRKNVCFSNTGTSLGGWKAYFLFSACQACSCFSPGIDSIFNSQWCEDFVPHCLLRREEKWVRHHQRGQSSALWMLPHKN